MPACGAVCEKDASFSPDSASTADSPPFSSAVGASFSKLRLWVPLALPVQTEFNFSPCVGERVSVPGSFFGLCGDKLRVAAIVLSVEDWQTGSGLAWFPLFRDSVPVRLVPTSSFQSVFSYTGVPLVRVERGRK